nr:hypothetical protein CFP56_71310 [Quercus suber]
MHSEFKWQYTAGKTWALVGQIKSGKPTVKVTIVGNSGNGECIVTTIFQRSFDPKSGGKQSCIKVTSAQRLISSFQQDYHIMATNTLKAESERINQDVLNQVMVNQATTVMTCPLSEGPVFPAAELQIIIRSRHFTNI